MIIEYTQIIDGIIREKLVDLDKQITTINLIGKTEEGSDSRPTKLISCDQEHLVYDLLQPFIDRSKQPWGRFQFKIEDRTEERFVIKSDPQYRFYRARLQRAKQICYNTDSLGIEIDRVIFVLPHFNLKLIVGLQPDSRKWADGFTFKMEQLKTRQPSRVDALESQIKLSEQRIEMLTEAETEGATNLSWAIYDESLRLESLQKQRESEMRR